MKKEKLSYSEIKKIVSKLPELEKNKPIIFYKDKYYSWIDILEELKRKTEISKNLLKELHRLRSN